MKLFKIPTQNILITGMLSGMRVNMGLLFTGLLIRQSPGNYFSSSRLVSFFYNKKAVTALASSGAAELVGDKLPGVPNRTDKGGLISRAVAGAVCGAAINIEAGKKPMQGALIGSLAAIASTYVFFYLRKRICEKTSIADPVIGAMEDAIAIGSGAAMLKSK